MTTYFDVNSFQDVRFGAALLFRPGIDIATHLSKISFDADLIENLKVVVVRPHTNLDKALSSSPGDHDRKKFHKLICWNKPRYSPESPPNTRLCERNRALLILITRCTLTYPDDR